MIVVKKSIITLLILALASLTGCASEKYPEGVVGIVNGKAIHEEDIEKEITEREMSIALSDKINSLEPSSLTPKEAIIKMLNINEKDLTPEQKRYIESVERSTIKPLSKNEAFNILLRKEVLYQEAVKKGHEVPISKAKEVLDETRELNHQPVIEDPEASEKQNEIVQYANEIYKQFGFNSEEDYLNQRIEKTAQTMSINRLQSRFYNVMENKFVETNNLQKSIALRNAWDDYGEYLLSQSDVKIINSSYSIEFYGGPWAYGSLDNELF